MPDDIRYILEMALTAPSVQNCQPWRWMVSGQTLELYAVPTRDCAAVDYLVPCMLQVALGMALENACIAASARGYHATVTYAPQPHPELLMARIVLSKDPLVRADELAAAIPARCTNHKPYETRSLHQRERDALCNEGGDRFVLTEGRSDIAALASALALHEELTAGNERAHYFLYSHINWTEEEDRRKGTGYNLPSLELGRNGPLFGLMGNWRFARLVGHLGVPQYVRREMIRLYGASAAFGVLFAEGRTTLDYLRAGRRSQRIWLRATALGLQIQPLLCIEGSVLAIDSKDSLFTTREAERIRDADQRIRRVFGERAEPIAFLCRIGHADPPSGRSRRLPFETVVQVGS